MLKKQIEEQLIIIDSLFNQRQSLALFNIINVRKIMSLIHLSEKNLSPLNVSFNLLAVVFIQRICSFDKISQERDSKE